MIGIEDRPTEADAYAGLGPYELDPIALTGDRKPS